MMISDSVMLNVKNASSRIGGSGTTTIASSATIRSGTPRPSLPTFTSRSVSVAAVTP
jgi:hypothetical protein